jgi:dTDP-4-amino-4,6-dideoxygalactose transaminase
VDPDAFGLTRDELALALAAENIETRKYYDPPVHRQFAYRQYATPADDLAHTDLLASRVLCMPIWSDMEGLIVSDICSAVERAYEFARELRAKLTKEENVAASAARRFE